MKRFYLTASLCCAATALLPSSASAFDINVDDALCPIETIGEAELNSWESSLVIAKGQLAEEQLNVLGEAVKTCAENLGWDEKDAISAVEFNLSILASSAIGDGLEADGIDAASYETVLKNRSAEDLRQILDDPDNSGALNDLTERLIADFGDDLTEEITADIATYIAFIAQSRFSVMKMLGLAD